MVTSGTYDSVANFNIAEIIDDAFRRCKISPLALTSDHNLSARMTLDLMFIDWINDGVQQFIIDKQVQVLTGTYLDISFTTPVGTIDVLDMVYRNLNGNDMQIAAVSRNDYLNNPNKENSGQPITYFVDKTAMPPTVFLWPVQNIEGTSVVYNRLRQIQDVGTPTNTPDTSVTYKEAVVACLADALWDKYGDDASYPGHGTKLTARAQNVYRRAKEQDRDRAPYIIKPRLGRRFSQGV